MTSMIRLGRRACAKNRGETPGPASRTRSHYKFRLFNVRRSRIRARRRETRSGKDITGLSRMTRRTGPQTGIIRRARSVARHVSLRMRMRKQVRFIYRIRIGEILRWRRETLSAGCNYSLMDIDLYCTNACQEGGENKVEWMMSVKNVTYKIKTAAPLTRVLTMRPEFQSILDFKK